MQPTRRQPSKQTAGKGRKKVGKEHPPPEPIEADTFEAVISALIRHPPAPKKKRKKPKREKSSSSATRKRHARFT